MHLKTPLKRNRQAVRRKKKHARGEGAPRWLDFAQVHSRSRFADTISGMAAQALLYEACATPKPGLVDRENSGAHTDMDLYTFIDSSLALVPYFRRMTALGMAHKGKPEGMLARLRKPGRQAEQRMLAATGGVNTHKGAIFSMGIVCAAAGCLYTEGEAVTPERLLSVCGAIAGETPHELETQEGEATYGREAYRRHGFTGVRGEAAAGFPNVLLCGYPELCRALQRGAGLNGAGVAALLHLFCHVEDTNIVGRAGKDALRGLRRRAKEIIRENDTYPKLLQAARELDVWMIRQNLSPGGCADLLALSYMLYFLFERDGNVFTQSF